MELGMPFLKTYQVYAIIIINFDVMWSLFTLSNSQYMNHKEMHQSFRSLKMNEWSG